MKKLLPILLTVLMVFGTALPVFAETANVVTEGGTELAAIGTELPEEFAAADQLVFLDYIEDEANADLLFGKDDSVEKPDFKCFPNAYGGCVTVYNDAKFAVPFELETAGNYTFVFRNFVRSDDTWNYIREDGTTQYPHPGTVQIDDGTVYTVSANAVLAAGLEKAHATFCFGPVTVALEAGEHVIYLSGNQSAGCEPYFVDVLFYNADDPDAAGDDTPAQDTPADDTPAASGAAVYDENPFADNDDYDLYGEVSYYASFDQYGNSMQNEGGGYNYYCWSPREVTTLTDAGKGGIWVVVPEYEYVNEFTPLEDGAYSLGLFLAHRTTANDGKTPWADTNVTTFNLTLMDGDEVIGTYTVEEAPGEVNSLRYYVFAEDVELCADTTYTVISTQNAVSTSVMVDLIYAMQVNDSSDDPAEDTTATQGGEQTSPATFDVAVIALAAAGVSAAAAAVVSKKRR